MSLKSRHLIVKENNNIVEVDIDIEMNDEIPEGTEINFLSKDEIIEDLIGRVLSGEDKKTVETRNPEDLNGLTTSLGSFIRNTYGLWLSPHPYSTRHSSADDFAEKISLEIIDTIKQRLA